ncbi:MULTISPECIES: hypothetical protein [Pseudoxanthomonas]|uniref:Uncharacterized protein n=1 Tax=Pseudoxanthomonas winnipegensis TaxID=2480810 RepID=A0AAW8GFV9_9GAMM|nr:MULTISPECIES: hypothetical protein [Pseudoxanthomonas]MDQ1121078.1 hypothetical protein [Pseudoxanthomonas winnipegensis]MDQ1134310.1 hypothetical protein [Pseudoxanthomonas winnipegensis]MDR6139459.1 hypothetical protein [Pseudoxanthomonas sp. SORGH_AS_0997]
MRSIGVRPGEKRFCFLLTRQKEVAPQARKLCTWRAAGALLSSYKFQRQLLTSLALNLQVKLERHVGAS